MNIGLIFIFIGIASAFSLVVGNNQFGGYDLAPLIDLSWRLSQGQIPNQDFITTFPLNFLMIAKLIGLNSNFLWQTFILANIILTFFSFYLSYFLMRKYKEENKKLFWLIGLSISIPLIYSNHVWHSSMSQLFSIIFFVVIYYTLNSKDKKFTDLFIFIGAALLAGAKQNLGIPLLLFSLSFFLIFKEKKYQFRYLANLIFGAAFGIFTLKVLLQMDLNGLTYLFTAVSDRIVPSRTMVTAILAVPSTKLLIGIFCLGIYLVILASYVTRDFRPKQVFALGVIGVSLIPMATDWDTKFNNLPLFFVALIFYLLNAPLREKSSRNVSQFIEMSLVVIIALSTISAFLFGFSRERMQQVGPFYEVNNQIRVDSKLFRGLSTGPQLSGIMSDLELIKSEGYTESVFIGPRIEWAYYEIGVTSPKGMPLYWLPGTSYSVLDESEIIRQFKEHNFSTCIFFDYTYLPSEIISYVESNYDQDKKFFNLSVFRIKK